MGSKFFGNRMEKQTPGKKGAKQKFANKNNNAKSGGVRKVGRGSQSSYLTYYNSQRKLILNYSK